MPPSGTHRISRRVEGRRHHHGRPDLLGEEAVAADLDLRRDGAGDVGVIAAGVVGVAEGPSEPGVAFTGERRQISGFCGSSRTGQSTEDLKCEQVAGVRRRGQKTGIHIESWSLDLVKLVD